MISYPEPPASNSADRWAFHFRMCGYDQGKMGMPLNPGFMHELPYIKGYTVGILEYQKEMERRENEYDEQRWMFESNQIANLIY